MLSPQLDGEVAGIRGPEGPVEVASTATVSVSSGSDQAGWRRVRRKRRRPAFVRLARGGDTPRLLSPDESEELKVIIWAEVLPPVRVIHKKLSRALPDVLCKSLKVRHYGVASSRRIEIFCESPEARAAVAAALKANPLRLPGERVALGRPYSARHPQPRKVVDRTSRNYFAPLTEETHSEEEHSIRVGTLNVDGLNVLFPELWKQTGRAAPTILGVVETYRHEGQGRFVLPGYTFLETRMRPGTRRGRRVDEDSHGVGFFVKKEWAPAVEPLENPPKFSDCQWIRLKKGSIFRKPIVTLNAKSYVTVQVKRELWIGVYYLAPRLNDRTIASVVAGMSDIARRARSMDAECIIVGDLNCCLRAVDDPLRTGTNGISERERLLGDLMDNHDLCSLHVLNPEAPLYTVIRGGTGRTMRDYIIVPRHCLERWRKPRVHHELDLDSDHCLLEAHRVKTVRIVKDSARLSDGVPAANQGIPRPHPGWKTRALLPTTPKSDKSDLVRDKISNVEAALVASGVIAERRDGSEEEHRAIIPNSYDAWKAAVEQALDKSLGRNGPRRKRKAPSFFNAEVWRCLVARRKAYAAVQRGVNKGAPEADITRLWADYLSCRRAARDALERARRSQWQSFMEEINSLPAGSRDFWRLLERSLGSQLTPWGSVQDKEGNLLDPLSAGYLPRWREYYHSLGAAGPNLAQSPLWNQVNDEVNSSSFFADPENDLGRLASLNSALSFDEVSEALKGLPNYKAIGADGFSNEVLKAMGPAALFGAMTQVWNSEICPSDWSLAIIHPLPKPGDPTNLGNTRGISLLSCTSKLFEAVLNRRLAEFLETGKLLLPEQGGFRATRECPEHVTTLYETVRRRKVAGQKTYLGFIDFAKAFDTVWRSGLLWKLHRIGVRGKMLRMIAALYKNTEAFVRVDGKYTTTFPIELGVRQGGILSPLLFLVYINDILDRMKAEGIGVLVPGIARENPFSPVIPKLSGLLWADDVVLLADSPEQLAKAFAYIDQWCREWGMSVNAKKSNVMVIGPDPAKDHAELVELCNTSPFTLGGGVVHPAKCYKYLGVQVSYDLSWDDALNARLDATRKVIFVKSRILRNADLAVDLRRRYFETVVTPVALWGSELWGNDKKVCARVDRELGTALRMILGMSASASRRALAWELGVAPVHLRVAARRVRLYLKWKHVAPTKGTSSMWARRLLQSSKQPGKHWSWFRRTTFMASWLGIEENRLAILQNGKTVVDLQKALAEASLGYFREWANAKQTGPRKLLSALHQDDMSLVMAPYLRYAVNARSIRALALMRTGAMFLNDRVHKFAPERPKSCQACQNTDATEDLEHFLLECPVLDECREDWARGWSVPKETLFKREPGSLLVALGESPQLLDMSEDQRKLWYQARAEHTSRMWRKRCTLQALNSRRVPTAPGVEATE